VGREYLDCPGGRAGGYRGRDQGRRDHEKPGRRIVEGDTDRASEIGAENLDARTDFASAGQALDKWGETHGEAKDGAVTVGTTVIGCPVEDAIGGLEQPCPRIRAVCTVGQRAEVVEGGQGAARSDFEDGASAVSAATPCHPIQVPIGSLDQPAHRTAAVRTAALCAEAV
jgi:hypothetical protein